MLVRKLRPSEIRIPDVRVTAVYDEELQQLLKDSLAAMGQVQPIVVVKSNNAFFLVDGLHRLEEAQKRGDSTIDAAIYEGEEKDVLLKNLVLNRLRGKTKASEMVTVIKSLYNDHGLDSDQIRDQTGLSRVYIEELIKISEASPSVQEALDRELIGVSHAFEISRIPSFIAQDEVIAKYQVWRWTVKELHDQVDQVLASLEEIKAAPPGEELPRPKAKYYCEACREEAALRYLRPVLLCPDCFGDVWRASRVRRQAVETEYAEEIRAAVSEEE